MDIENNNTENKMSKKTKENKFRYKLCGDRIAFEDYKLKKTTKVGSLYMPDGLIDDLAKGKVMAVGPDVTTVEVGDVIIIVPDLGTHLTDGKKKYRTLPENAVMAIDHAFDEEKECE